MNQFARILQPPDRFVSGLESGRYTLDGTNRVRDAQTGRFVAALVLK